MACEELEAAFDEAMSNYDNAVAFENSVQQDLQQAQWATMAAMGQVMMAWMLLQSCLNGQGATLGMAAMRDALSIPEKFRAKVFELRKAVKGDKG